MTQDTPSVRHTSPGLYKAEGPTVLILLLNQHCIKELFLHRTWIYSLLLLEKYSLITLQYTCNFMYIHYSP